MSAIYTIQKGSASVTCNGKPVTIVVATSIILHDNLCKNLQEKTLEGLEKLKLGEKKMQIKKKKRPDFSGRQKK